MKHAFLLTTVGIVSALVQACGSTDSRPAQGADAGAGGAVVGTGGNGGSGAGGKLSTAGSGGNGAGDNGAGGNGAGGNGAGGNGAGGGKDASALDASSEAGDLDATMESGTVACRLPNGSRSAADAGALSTGLVARYCFDDALAVGHDCSGNGHDLTASSGVQVVTDGFGKAISLGGVSDYLERVGDPAFVPGTREWSLTAWVRPTLLTDGVDVPNDGGSDWGWVAGWYRCGATASCDGSSVYDLYVTGRGEGYMEVRGDTPGDITLFSPRGSVTNGCWHHLAGTFASNGNTTHFYVDGVAVATSTAQLKGLTTGATPVPFEIGRAFITGWGTPLSYFAGEIDEVRVYQRQLSAGEVTELASGSL